MNKRIHWGNVILDICIISMAIGISIWQDNTTYLWLIALAFCTGSTTIKETSLRK